MIPPLELMSKLGLKSGDRLWLINAPRELAEELAAGAEVEMVHEADEKSGVIASFDSPSEVDALATRILEGLPDGGLLWLCGAENNWDAFATSGWRPSDEIEIGEGRSLKRLIRGV